jgi:hypothetical protein
MKSIKAMIDPIYHRHIDDWDQEHCIVLGAGAFIRGLQSVMPKPPNI